MTRAVWSTELVVPQQEMSKEQIWRGKTSKLRWANLKFVGWLLTQSQLSIVGIDCIIAFICFQQWLAGSSFSSGDHVHDTQRNETCDGYCSKKFTRVKCSPCKQCPVDWQTSLMQRSSDYPKFGNAEWQVEITTLWSWHCDGSVARSADHNSQLPPKTHIFCRNGKLMRLWFGNVKCHVQKPREKIWWNLMFPPGSSVNFQEKWLQNISQKLLHTFHEAQHTTLSPQDSGGGGAQQMTSIRATCDI